jgi:hypothetical protein
MGKSEAISVVLWILTLTLGVQAQDTVPRLGYGDWIQGEIGEDGRPQRWQFQGRNNDIILIDLIVPTNSELDPVLQLVSPSGIFISQDDDGGNHVNARIGPLSLPEDGTYEILAEGYSGHGRFWLGLNTLEELPTLTLNKPLEVQLTEQHPLAYLFIENPPASVLNLSAETEDPTAAPILTLYDEQGEQVRDAYIQAGGIDPLMSQANTCYVVAVEIAFPHPNESHAYTISLLPSEIDLLENGNTRKGQITPAAATLHFFQGKMGQRIKLSLTLLDGNISPALYVRSVDSQQFLFSNSGQSLRNLTATLNIPADGLYVIEVADSAYTGEQGSYLIHLDVLP